MASKGVNPEDLREPYQLPYFFPEFKNLSEVVDLLSYHIQVNGAFILRNSSSGNNYTITVVHKGGVKHIKIQGKEGSYWLANKKFKRLSDLIEYYGQNDVPNMESVTSVRLTHPVTQHYANTPEETGIVLTARQNSQENGERREVRPPPPPPPPPVPHVCPGLYDYAANIQHNHAAELIIALQESERCECGLYITDAMLPEGWALHLTERGGERVFFVSPDNQSSWVLPAHIKAKLDPHQRSVLKRYKAL